MYQRSTPPADLDRAATVAMFNRALAGWIADLINLGRRGLDRPSYRDPRTLLVAERRGSARARTSSPR